MSLEESDSLESDDIKIEPFSSLTPKEQVRRYLITGCILVSLLIIAAAILGVYIAEYKTSMYYIEMIKQHCECNGLVY